MINEKGQVIAPFTTDAIEYLKKAMKKESTWHRFDCYLMKRGDDIYVSQPCLVVDPAHVELDT